MPRKRESASDSAVSSKTRTRSAQKLTNNGRGDGEAAEALSKTPKRKSAPSTKSASSKRPKRKDLSLKRCDSASGEADLVKEEMDEAEEVFNTEVLSDEEENETSEPNADWKAPQFKAKLREKKDVEEDDEVRFMGKPVPEEEARKRWPHRYQAKKLKKFSITEESEEVVQARKHYTRAEVDKIVYNLYDDAHVWAGVDSDCHICKIIEMFEATDGSQYITSQWYYRARDTAIKHVAKEIDENRVFFSEIKDDNDLSCLVKKLSIARVPLNVDLKSKIEKIPACDYFCDMMYLLPFSSFVNLPENVDSGNETSSTISSDVDTGNECEIKSDHKDSGREKKAKLLDLYAGCGGMSTGLCSGARMAGLDLETGWAIDINSFACESLKWNHPETQVRNETAEDFLSLMKEWRKLCIYFSLVQPTSEEGQITFPFPPQEDEATDDNDNDDDEADDDNNDPEVFEVEEILDICYGDPNLTRKGRKLHFKVHWKNYGPEEDTWEPTEGLSDAPMIVKKFVTNGFMAKIIPLPGDVDVVCGGPPCQGVSGFNRFRNKENPLADEKNMQLLVYMDIVDYLKPKYVLMENVVDLVKFADGFLGKYALARLIKMNYQTRLGLMAAGSYGLPQFRRRVFLWGARPEESLPQFPLPTHDVVRKGGKPNEFEMNLVLYEEGKQPELEKKLFLEDAISDLPPVGNFDNKDEMEYVKEPKTEFQRFIRSRKEVMRDSSSSHSTDAKLFDHRPYKMNQDDYDRVCEVPKKKGANFRDLPGVLVGPNNVVYWDPKMERVLLTSGKPLVPDYAMSFVKGRSSKPFGRLWWDETVPTVVTRPEPHNQKILHPTQDRVLTVRENARLQGFPDYYKLFGPIKERYIQVGNAVAVPVARALGYSLAMAYQGLSNAGNEPLFQLPAGFPNVLERNSPEPESSQGLD